MDAAQTTRRALLGLAATVLLLPGAALGWWNDEWTGRKPIQVETGPAGAALGVPVTGAVVLVRLHAGNFKFEVAKEDGSDLRFVAGDDKTPLHFQLEKYDGLLGEALAWVALPEVQPGARTSFWLYYGNPKAPPAEDPKGAYDQATALVYHFGDAGQPPRDAGPWGLHAAGAAQVADGGLIGRALKLDGSSVLTIPGGPAAAWSAGGQMTWSAWVRPAAADADGVLLSRRDGARAFLVGFAGGRPWLELQGDGEPRRATGPAAFAPGTWRHLAVTAADGLTLYVDGEVAATLPAPLPALDSALTLGGDPGAPAAALPAAAKGGAAPAPAPTGFKGEVDELQLAKVPRGGAWLRLAALTQGTDPGKVVLAGQDEQGGSSGGGYFAVILRSVTLDGWVVIGILAIMAVVSWWVMASKAGYLGAVEKANERFQERFQRHAGSLPELVTGREAAGALGDEKPLRDSPLFRIFQIAANEIRGRTDGRQALHVESIEAIRASLDAGMVRENQRLSNRLVLLTIAISGGPFLGLLGTVVGVMITFAAIAAAGEVNVNAIAPGIAAALVATVAGLGVAIPALFGYNWLLTRSKEATATMQVFVDELVTKVAESYSERAIQDRGRPAAIHVVVDEAP